MRVPSFWCSATARTAGVRLQPQSAAGQPGRDHRSRPPRKRDDLRHRHAQPEPAADGAGRPRRTQAMVTADFPDPGLAVVAQKSGGGYVEIRFNDDLGAAFARVADELHSQYLLGFAPPKRDGKRHEIDVRPAQKGLTPAPARATSRRRADFTAKTPRRKGIFLRRRALRRCVVAVEHRKHLTPPPTVILSYDSWHALSTELQVRQARLPAARGSGEGRRRVGRGPAGEPLPSIRPLAEELRVNRNTVAKAYAELESQGVIETIAGKGCFVRANNSPFKKEVRLKLLTGRSTTPWCRRITSGRQGGVPPARRRSLRRVPAPARRAREGMTHMTPDTPVIEIDQPGAPLRPHRRRQRPEPARAARPLLRLLRPQRRRQDHDDQVPAEPAAADERRGEGVRPGSGARTKWPSSRGSPTCRTPWRSIPG